MTLWCCCLQVPGNAAAVQVAQAAQAVQQQAQSLHAAAEVHAQKAQEATSQVASLQATAHVSGRGAQTLFAECSSLAIACSWSEYCARCASVWQCPDACVYIAHERSMCSFDTVVLKH